MSLLALSSAGSWGVILTILAISFYVAIVTDPTDSEDTE